MSNPEHDPMSSLCEEEKYNDIKRMMGSLCEEEKYNDIKRMIIIKYKNIERKFKESIECIYISQLIFKNYDYEHKFTKIFGQILDLLNGEQCGGGNNYIISLRGLYINYILISAGELFIIMDNILKKKEEINREDINYMYILYILLKYIKRNPDMLDPEIKRYKINKDIDCEDYEIFPNIIIKGYKKVVEMMTAKDIELENPHESKLDSQEDCYSIECHEKHKYLKYKLKYLKLKKIKNHQ
jgi:hypothetical protein